MFSVLSWCWFQNKFFEIQWNPQLLFQITSCQQVRSTWNCWNLKTDDIEKEMNQVTRRKKIVDCVLTVWLNRQTIAALVWLLLPRLLQCNERAVIYVIGYRWARATHIVHKLFTIREGAGAPWDEIYDAACPKFKDNATFSSK